VSDDSLVGIEASASELVLQALATNASVAIATIARRSGFKWALLSFS
jgi:hypothetical protein